MKTAAVLYSRGHWRGQTAFQGKYSLLGIWWSECEAVVISCNTNILVIFSSLELLLKRVGHPFVRRPSVCKLHIFKLISWWILMKFGRDEILMVPYKSCCFSARVAQGRLQGGAKLVTGSPSLMNFFRLDGYSNSNRMHSYDLEVWEEVLLVFCSIPKSNVWRVFLDLVSLVYFNAFSIDFIGKSALFIYL